MAVILETFIERVGKLKKPSKEQKLKQQSNPSTVNKMKVCVHPQIHVDQIMNFVEQHHNTRQEVQHIRVNFTTIFFCYQ